MVTSVAVLTLAGSKPCRLPALGRDPDGERAEQHVGQVDDGEGQEELAHRIAAGHPALVPPELGSYNFSSAVETGLAISAPPPKPMIAMPGGQAGPVREPFDQGGHRRDVADAQADAADDAVAQVDQPELVGEDAQRADQEAASPEQRPR